jgi:hypothetical protein
MQCRVEGSKKRREETCKKVVKTGAKAEKGHCSNNGFATDNK